VNELSDKVSEIDTAAFEPKEAFATHDDVIDAIEGAMDGAVVPTNLTGTIFDLNSLNFGNGYAFGKWKCTSEIGSANIANKPVAQTAFLLELVGHRTNTPVDFEQVQLMYATNVILNSNQPGIRRRIDVYRRHINCRSLPSGNGGVTGLQVTPWVLIETDGVRTDAGIPVTFTTEKTFSLHPIVPSVMAQTPFINRRDNRYVTEAQLAAGGVGLETQHLTIEPVATMSVRFSGARYTLYRKNGYVTACMNAQASSAWTASSTDNFQEVALPAGFIPPGWIGIFPVQMIRGLDRIIIGDVRVSTSGLLVVFNSGTVISSGSWFRFSFTYPHA
jgi:hypothetical protein